MTAIVPVLGAGKGQRAPMVERSTGGGAERGTATMQIHANVRTRFLKPKSGWKNIGLDNAVGKLTLEATRPDDTQLLRYLYETLGGRETVECTLTITRGGKKVCEYVQPPDEGMTP